MTIYQEIGRAEAEGQSLVLCTVVSAEGSTPRSAGSKMLVYPDGRTSGTVGGGELEARVVAEALASLETGAPRLIHYEMADPARGDPGVCGGQMEVYVEPVTPPITVAVVGAGHVGRSVADLANWLGLRVLVSDDREEFCTPEVVPDADGYFPMPMAALPDAFRVTPRTFFVLCTRNVEVDVAGLPALLETPAPYIGVIGSRRRWATTREKLLENGVAAESLERVRSPMGLELNAETPNEIAVSILAEIIMLSSGGHGRPMADTTND